MESVTEGQVLDLLMWISEAKQGRHHDKVQPMLAKEAQLW